MSLAGKERHEKYVNEIQVYQGFVRAEQDVVHQAATKTRCSITKGFCSPMEDHKLVLIYQKNLPTLPSVYKYLGDFQVTRVESLITIPKLESGGSVAFETDDAVTLETGILLRKKT